MLKLSEIFGFTGDAVTVADVGDQFTIDTAEAALQQLAAEVDTLEADSSGSGTLLLGSLTQSMIATNVANITLSEGAEYPIVTVAKEIPQTGFINSDWGIETNDTTFDTSNGVLDDGKFGVGVTQTLDTKVAITNATGQIDSSNMANINTMTPVEANVVAGGFNTVLYTGNSTTNPITKVGFQPDLIWVKRRDTSRNHVLFDSVRGANSTLSPNETYIEYTDTINTLLSFDSDGFTLGVDDVGGIGTNSNLTGSSMVAWCWKAGGAAVENTDGSITSQVSANQELGFSIVSYDGNDTSGATIGHGLDKAPDLMIVKMRTTAGVWHVYHKDVGPTKFLKLNESSAEAVAASRWNNTNPDDTTFTLGNDWEINNTGDEYIAYCFAEIPGFSKFGSYEGNGSVDGPEIDLGFKPEFIMIKRTDVANDWITIDATRGMNSIVDPYLSANKTNVDGLTLDILTTTDTGFKINIVNVAALNDSGGNYIYMAFGKKVEAKGDKVFGAVTYAGNSTVRTVKCGFQPDLVWTKPRNTSNTHHLYDSVRGAGNYIDSDSTIIQTYNADSLISFDVDGYTAQSAPSNYLGRDYIAWCWKKGPSCGLDIVTYTGDNTNGKTVTHNLGKKPAMFICKSLTGTQGWSVYHKSIGNTAGVYLHNNDAAVATIAWWNNTDPTDTTITLGGGSPNAAQDYIAYIFAEIPGYSKFGSYIGNGSANGPEVNLGFKPAFLMIKSTESTGAYGEWQMFDSERFGKALQADVSSVEIGSGLSTGAPTFTNSGFKLNNSSTNSNTDGENYIYMAFGNTLPAVSEPRGFAAQTYIGDGSGSHSITGFGFQPDLVWIKNRSVANSPTLVDSVRGVPGNRLEPDSTNGESTNATGVQSLDSDGVTLGTHAVINNNGDSFISWAWKAGGAAVANTDGTIPTQISANQELGFSIISFTGTEAIGTIGHGLSQTPELVIYKNRDMSGHSWRTYHKSVGSTKALNLDNSSAGHTTAEFWNNIDPDDTVCTLNYGVEVNGINNMIAYAWHSVPGYSKFGGYVGNGSTTGPIINCGFRPAFVMIKRTSGVQSWHMNTAMQSNATFTADVAGVENPAGDGLCVMNDNGFQIMNTVASGWNGSNDTYIFIAFGGTVPTQESKSSNYALSTDGRTTWQVVQNEKGFETVLYEGNREYSHGVDGVGFSPDLVWIKNRTTSTSGRLVDTVRGAGNEIQSSEVTAQTYSLKGLHPFDSDGFSVNDWTGYNGVGDDMVAWCWKAGGPAVENTNGTITSQVSANQDLGFSIISYTGNDTAGATVGHGLGAAPDLVMIKNLAAADNWVVYHNSIGASDALFLNTDGVLSPSSAYWNDIAPDNSVITFGIAGNVNDPVEFIAYAWTSIPGFSSFGSYTGTGTADNEINCGFEPTFVMVKRTNDTGHWYMWDASRGSSENLQANLNSAAGGTHTVDFTATGFTLTSTHAFTNGATDNYIYIAFAKNVPQSLRNIVQNNTGTWEVNTNPTGTTWTDAANLGAANTQEGALKKAFEYDFNQMSGDALKSAGSLLPTPGDTLDVAMEASDELSIENVSFNYDMESNLGYMVQGTDYSVRQTSSTNIEITSNVSENFHVKVRG